MQISLVHLLFLGIMWCCGWSEGPWICWNYDWISSLWFMNFYHDSWNCCAVYSSRVCDSPPHETSSWHRQDVLMPQRVGMLIVGEILQEIHIFHHSISPSRDNSRRVSAAATFTPKKHKFSASLWADRKKFFCSCSQATNFCCSSGPFLSFCDSVEQEAPETFETIHHNLSYIS